MISIRTILLSFFLSQLMLIDLNAREFFVELVVPPKNTQNQLIKFKELQDQIKKQIPDFVPAQRFFITFLDLGNVVDSNLSKLNDALQEARKQYFKDIDGLPNLSLEKGVFLMGQKLYGFNVKADADLNYLNVVIRDQLSKINLLPATTQLFEPKIIVGTISGTIVASNTQILSNLEAPEGARADNNEVFVPTSFSLFLKEPKEDRVYISYPLTKTSMMTDALYDLKYSLEKLQAALRK